MKKILTLFLTVPFILSAVSCSKTEEPAKNETNSELLQYYENTDIYFDYKTNHYKFRLPEYWKGKFTVETKKGVENFYETNSFDADGSGLIFSVYEFEDESYKKELTNYTYLCYDERFELHYVLTTPETPQYVAEFEETYNELVKAINIVKATFKAEL